MKLLVILGIVYLMFNVRAEKKKTLDTNEALDTNEDLDTNEQNNNNSVAAHTIALQLITSVLEVNVNTNEKLIKLQEKLHKIYSYTFDEQKYSDLLLNESLNNDWNRTSFYDALYEHNDYQFLEEKDPKNVYYQLKKRMNRQDIFKILRKNKIKRSDANHAVDKLLMEPNENKNKYNASGFYSEYWDPTSFNQELMSGRRLFKGERTYIKYYPFMVSVHLMNQFFCGGVIYAADVILTSASCLQLLHNNRFFRENPKVLNVRVGSNHSRIGGEKIDALEVFFHPGYNPKTLFCNIAAVRLVRYIKFKHFRVPKMIEISPRTTAVPNEIKVLLLGWGVTRATARLKYEPVFLQRKLVPVYASIFCKQIYGRKFDLKTMFCAGSITEGNGACDHDAGGPAVFNGYLVGVISYGSTQCGTPNQPTVFTHAGAFRSWAEGIVKSKPSYAVAYARTTISDSAKKYPGKHSHKDPKTPSLSSDEMYKKKDNNEIESVWSTPSPYETITPSHVDTPEAAGTSPKSHRSGTGLKQRKANFPIDLKNKNEKSAENSAHIDKRSNTIRKKKQNKDTAKPKQKEEVTGNDDDSTNKGTKKTSNKNQKSKKSVMDNDDEGNEEINVNTDKIRLEKGTNKPQLKKKVADAKTKQKEIDDNDGKKVSAEENAPQLQKSDQDSVNSDDKAKNVDTSKEKTPETKQRAQDDTNDGDEAIVDKNTKNDKTLNNNNEKILKKRELNLNHDEDKTNILSNNERVNRNRRKKIRVKND